MGGRRAAAEADFGGEFYGQLMLRESDLEAFRLRQECYKLLF